MATRTPGERWNCTACGTPLIGALTTNGKVAPIEVEPSAEGTVLLHRITQSREKVVSAWTLAGITLETARSNGIELRSNHFVTCEHADRFRPKQATDAGT